MRCAQCGASVGRGAHFCRACGAKVDEVLAEPPRCPHCGAGVASTAQFCRACGQQIPGTRQAAAESPSPAAIGQLRQPDNRTTSDADEQRVGVVTSPIARPIRRWVIAIAVSALVLGLIGAGVLVGLTGGSSSRRATAPTVPDPGVTVVPTPSPVPPQTAPPAPTTPPAAPPGPDNRGTPPGQLATWPRSTGGYTVQLGAYRQKTGAVTTARQAMAQGFPAGILSSSDFPSFTRQGTPPGLWIVFSGRFSDPIPARRDVGRARTSGFPRAFVRQVMP
jgi:cell division septation protein DedD